MKMKRSFVCLLLVLSLALLLVGCGSAADGVVGNSPAPIGVTPALPVPSAEVSMAPVPGETMRPRGDSAAGTNVDPGTSASPSPDSEMQRDR